MSNLANKISFSAAEYWRLYRSLTHEQASTWSLYTNKNPLLFESVKDIQKYIDNINEYGEDIAKTILQL